MGKEARRDYEVVIRECSKELDKREKVKLKLLANATLINEMENKSTIKVQYSAVLDVHNEHVRKGEKTDYVVYVFVDADGNMYQTSSESFYKQYKLIEEEMEGEEFSIIVLRQKSATQKSSNGEQAEFLTCDIE